MCHYHFQASRFIELDAKEYNATVRGNCASNPPSPQNLSFNLTSGSRWRVLVGTDMKSNRLQTRVVSIPVDLTYK